MSARLGPVCKHQMRAEPSSSTQFANLQWPARFAWPYQDRMHAEVGPSLHSQLPAARILACSASNPERAHRKRLPGVTGALCSGAGSACAAACHRVHRWATVHPMAHSRRHPWQPPRRARPPRRNPNPKGPHSGSPAGAFSTQAWTNAAKGI